jgi:hypothetical protein
MEGLEKDETDRLSRQLDRIVAGRIEVNRSVWTVFTVFMAAMAVMISAVANEHTAAVRAGLSAVGALAALIWAAFIARALGHLELHEHIMEGLEDKLGIPGTFSALRNRNPQAHVDHVVSHFPWPIRPILVNGAAVTFFGWFIAFVVFLLRANP